jgi:peptidylglycine monooxygenase
VALRYGPHIEPWQSSARIEGPKPVPGRPKEGLVVALGDRRYRVERPWGALPPMAGRITAVTVDHADRVYVLARHDPYAATCGDPVHVLDSEGALLGSFGATRLSDAHMIACDGAGRIWVVDRDAHEVVAFDACGREVASLGNRHRPLEPFNHPTDIAFAPDGTIVVADGYANALVHRFSADGAPLGAWGRVGHEPGAFMTVHSVWVVPDGRIVVADRDNHRLQVFSPDGVLLKVIRGVNRPSDLWGDREGRVYVTDAIPTLTCFTPDGMVLGRCRPVLDSAHGLWGDSRGRIYIAECNPSRVTRLVPIAA